MPDLDMDARSAPSNGVKWKLRVDYREKKSQLFQLVARDDIFEVQIAALQTGDYIVNDRIALERKSHADFALSIIDGRLFHQIAMLSRVRQRPLILVEGPKPDVIPRVHPNALKGALLSLAVAWRVPVVFSRCPDESLVLLRILAEQSQAIRGVEPAPRSLPPKGGDRQKLFVLLGLPGVGPKLAVRLLGRFGSVEKVMQAGEVELASVPGCGPAKAAAIRRVLGPPR